ncbi:MAG: hypothetical protein ACYC09_10000 [Bacteroidota bacterium]
MKLSPLQDSINNPMNLPVFSRTLFRPFQPPPVKHGHRIGKNSPLATFPHNTFLPTKFSSFFAMTWQVEDNLL